LFCLLRLRHYKAKCVKTRCLQEWVGHLEAKFQGEGVVPGEYFLVSTKLDTFCYPTVQTAPCYTCRRFDTIPACDGRTDGRTDGIALANTALACNASIAERCKNPIQRTASSVSYVCAVHCVQLLHTMLRRTDLIIFPVALQTITIAPMMSIRGKGNTMDEDEGLGHGHIVLDGDPALPKGAQPPVFGPR